MTTRDKLDIPTDSVVAGVNQRKIRSTVAVGLALVALGGGVGVMANDDRLYPEEAQERVVALPQDTVRSVCRDILRGIPPRGISADLLSQRVLAGADNQLRSPTSLVRAHLHFLLSAAPSQDGGMTVRTFCAPYMR